MKLSIGKRIWIGVGIGLAVLVINGTVSYLATRALIDHQRLVSLTHEVLGELEATSSTMKDAETGQRGYIITGDERYLEPYLSAVAQIHQRIEKVRLLTADDAIQKPHMNELERRVNDRLDRLKEGVELRKGGNPEGARQLILSGIGKRQMDELRLIVNTMADQEKALLNRRTEEARASGRYVLLTDVIPNLVAILLISLIGFMMVRDVSARSRAEQEVREQRELLRVTLSSVGEGVIATGVNADVTFMNPMAQSLTGWSQREAEGVSIKKVLHIVTENAREVVENPALRTMESGKTTGVASHTVLIAKGGREVPIDSSASPIRDSAGNISGAVLVLRDVTERRRAERAQVLLAGIVESSEDAIISKTIDGIVTSWNGAAERLFEHTADEVIGRSITLIIPPERLDEEQLILQRLRKGERLQHFETVRVAKSGRLLDISLTVSPVLGSDGEVVGASKIARDITARKRAEEAVRQQREWLNVTLSSIGDGVIATDTKGVITFLNPVAQSLTAWRPEEAIGRGLEEVFRIKNGQTGEPVENPALRAISDGRIIALANHAVLIAKNGAEVPIDDSGAPIRDADGKLIGAVLIFRDVTERQRAEAERTKLLAAEQAARQLAEQANRAKDEFVAVISHEIRSPLTAILGWAQMLRTGTFNKADTARAIETIERNAKAQVQLVEDLLDLSRVITGKLDLRMQTVELSTFVKTAVESIRPAADAKAITVNFQAVPGGSYVSADPDRFQQILWNVLSNAVKFTPTRGKIEITLTHVESQAQISVTDSGIGMSPEFLPFVFDRFSQASTASKRKYQGLGLGLAIVRHLVELHGGTVRAASPGEGLGATFTIALPIRAVRQDLSEFGGGGETHSSSDSLADTISLVGVNVLIVDDEAETRDLLTTVLKQRGAEVRKCSSAEEALRSVVAWRPMVIVSDIGMPDIDGYDFIRTLRLKEHEQGGNTPAVALTAYARLEDRMRALTAGYQMHLTKPVEAAELVTVVASLAGRISQLNPESG